MLLTKAVFSWIMLIYVYAAPRRDGGEMEKKADTAVRDGIRFNGWSEVPYITRIQYEALEGLQEQKIQKFTHFPCFSRSSEQKSGFHEKRRENKKTDFSANGINFIFFGTIFS